MRTAEILAQVEGRERDRLKTVLSSLIKLEQQIRRAVQTGHELDGRYLLRKIEGIRTTGTMPTMKEG